MGLILPTACHGQITDADVLDEPASTASSSLPDLSDSSDDSGESPTEPTGSSGDTSTSDADPSTGSTSADASTGAASYCGDGSVDDGEACDDGEANSDNGHCTEGCALNVCGDGLVFVGVELCDDGPSNSDAYGSTCGSQCTPAPRCGDGLLQVEEEECDLGNGNGTDEVDDDGVKCTSLCRLVAYRGFITSAVYTGKLGGLAGADAKCRLAAYAAELPHAGTYRAFLSGDDVTAKQRFADRIGDPTPYFQAGGQMFAPSFDALLAHGPGDLGIFTTEFGESLYWAPVATNTAPGGGVSDPATSCLSWQSDDKALSAGVGMNAMALDDPTWSTWKAMDWWTNQGVMTCDSTYFHLYCLE